MGKVHAETSKALQVSLEGNDDNPVSGTHPNQSTGAWRKKRGQQTGKSQDLVPPRALGTNPKLPRNKNWKKKTTHHWRMEAVIVNRRGKKMANLVWQKSVTIILFEITFCQTSLSFKQIFCKRPENIKWRSRQNTKVIALWHLSHTSVLLSSSSCCLLCKLTKTCLKHVRESKAVSCP